MLIVKSPEADLQAKSGFVFDICLIASLFLVCLFFYMSEPSEYESTLTSEVEKQMEMVTIPPTEQISKPPPPSRPQIPIEAEDEDEVDELTIDDTEVDITQVFTDIAAPEEDDEPLEFFAVSEKPQILKAGAPKYPSIAQKAGIEATVLIKFTIDEKGMPIGFAIVKGHPMLNDAALEAAKEYRFSPAKQNDKAVKVRWSIPFRFRLNN